VRKSASLRLVVSVLLLLLLFVGSAWSQEIAFGPYVQNVTQNRATICWATLDGEVAVTAPGGAQSTFRNYQVHQVDLLGLAPNTLYNYNVLPGDPSSGGAFRTAPDAATPFTFVVFGDTRSRHDIHRRIVEALMAHKPAFVINTGDLVSDGRRMSDWEPFFDINRELMRNTPYYPVLGNHENDSPHYFNFFALPGDERNYTFDWGAAHFICLDLEGPEIYRPHAFPYGEVLRGQTREQYLKQVMQFLREDLDEHADAPFIFVVFHYPPYSAKASRQEGAEEVRDLLGSVLATHRVTAVLNGHDHYYMRAEADGVTYVVTGGGGAPLYEPDAPIAEAVKIAKVEHFVRVDIQPPAQDMPGLATFTAYDIDGQVIDSWQTPAR